MQVRVEWSDDDLVEWAFRTASALGWTGDDAPRAPFDIGMGGRMRRTLLELTRWPRAMYLGVLDEVHGLIRPVRDLSPFVACHDVVDRVEVTNDR